MYNHHEEVINWYINREVVAFKKSATHEKAYLERLLDEPHKEIKTINEGLQQIIFDATNDLNYVPRICKRSFASELVSACRKYFLGTDD